MNIMRKGGGEWVESGKEGKGARAGEEKRVRRGHAAPFRPSRHTRLWPGQCEAKHRQNDNSQDYRAS